MRGELQKRQWIIFDGDVDPEWVENLNSVLDDNKLLTLPNGERLSLPPNVMFFFLHVYMLSYKLVAFTLSILVLSLFLITSRVILISGSGFLELKAFVETKHFTLYLL